MRRWVLLLALCSAAIHAHALEGEAASHLQRLLADATRVPHEGDTAAMPVREFGQTVWALTLAGELPTAQRIVELGLAAAGTAAGSGRPAGALPPTLHADGSTDDPRYRVDAQAVAAVLEATARYVDALPEADRLGWLNKWWKEIELAGSFVIGWTYGPRGAPFPAYDPRYGRDVGGVRESMGALLATICAQELAAVAGKTVPETWQQRRDALEALVRTTDFRDGGRAIVNLPWGAAQLRGILSEDHPVWEYGLGDTTVREYAWRQPQPNEPAQLLISLLARAAATP